MAEQGPTNDVILTHLEYVLMQDGSQGNVRVIVGPWAKGKGTNDIPVIFDDTGKFRRTSLEAATQQFVLALEGQYVILDNPVLNDEQKVPREGGQNDSPKLAIGRRIVIPGPCSFALFPGQRAKVIPGHILRSDQYLVAVVTNANDANANWGKAIMQPAKKVDGEQHTEGDVGKADAAQQKVQAELDNALTMGQRLIIPGTDVCFFIPPTGIEVVAENGRYVRDAVRLELLEYCQLRDENGKTRFEIGDPPKIVFPAPTELFTERGGARKWRALELNDNMGLHVKVVQAYTDEAGEHRVGDELFLKGPCVYFPREEHAIIHQGDDPIHYAVAIPEGDGRYVLTKSGEGAGKVELVKGPCMFLPDPRTEVIVQRVLTDDECALMYPGNTEVLEHNRRLRGVKAVEVPELGDIAAALSAKHERPASYGMTKGAFEALADQGAAVMRSMEEAGEGVAARALRRKATYTPPRQIKLGSRFDGVVKVRPWTGFAVKVVDTMGKSRVVMGPEPVLLEYDEYLEPLTLWTGTPKTDKSPIRTVFLRHANNLVSDLIANAQTSDMVDVSFRVRYLVNFEGDSSLWWNVENYIALLVEHLRSVLRNIVGQHGIEEFNRDATKIIRDAILGASIEGDDGKKARKGLPFPENGMRIYDVEVLDLEIGDETIAQQLEKAQHAAVQRTLKVQDTQAELEATKRVEAMNRDTADEKAKTAAHQLKLKVESADAEHQAALKAAANQQTAAMTTAKNQHELATTTMANKNAAALAEIEFTIVRAAKSLEDELGRQKIRQQHDQVLAAERAAAQITLEAEHAAATIKLKAEQTDADKAAQAALAEISKSELDRVKASNEEAERHAKTELDAQTEALKAQCEALGKDIVAALQAFGDQALTQKVAEALAPLAMFRNSGIGDVLEKALAGTPLSGVVDMFKKGGHRAARDDR